MSEKKLFDNYNGDDKDITVITDEDTDDGLDDEFDTQFPEKEADEPFDENSYDFDLFDGYDYDQKTGSNDFEDNDDGIDSLDDELFDAPKGKRFEIKYDSDMEDYLLEDQIEKPKKKKSKKKKGLRIIPSLIAVIIILSLLITGSSYYVLRDITYEPLAHTWEDVIAERAPQWELAESNLRYCNILLIGADGNLKSSRSDTMILLSIDRLTLKIRLVSFLRDTYVQIPGHGKNRLNAAFAFGGAQLLMRTLEANFRIKIDKYISVDFDSLEAIVDSMGGITMEISDAEARYINRYSERGTKALVGGEQHLNGNEALHYARIRKLDSDFGRTNRQRKLIEKIVRDCVSTNPLKLIKIIENAAQNLTTNISRPELMWIGVQGLIAALGSFEELYLPLSDGYSSQTIDGMAVLVPDLTKNCQALHGFLFGTQY